MIFTNYSGLGCFVAMVFICLFIINIYFIIIYRKLDEFKYIKRLCVDLKNMVSYKYNNIRN